MSNLYRCRECGALMLSSDRALHREFHIELMKSIMVAADIYDPDKVDDLVVPYADKLGFEPVSV